MSISGLVLHIHPADAEGMRDRIGAIAGVEVHAVTGEGRVVITVDLPDDRAAADTFMELQNMAGVLSTALVYNHFDQDPAEKEPAR